MKKQLFLLAALLISATTFATTITINGASGFSSSYPSDETTLTIDEVNFLYKNVKYSAKNTPTSAAAVAKSFLQMKSAKDIAGEVYLKNAAALTMKHVLVYLYSDLEFSLSAGTAADALSALEKPAAKDGTVKVFDKDDPALEKDINVKIYDFNVTDKTFFKFEGGDNGNSALYISQIVITDEDVEDVHPSEVVLDKQTAKLSAYEKLQLTAEVHPDNAQNKAVTWKSSNEEVATVSDKGLVSAWAAGSAEIIVTTVDGEKTDTCVLTVEAAKPSDFIVISADQLKDKDTVVITMTVDSVGIPMVMEAVEASSTGPKAIAGGFIQYSIAPANDEVTFIAHIDENGIIFVPKGHELNDSVWLYVAGAPNNNDGVRVKKVAKKDAAGAKWSVDEETGYLKASYLYHEGEDDQTTIVRYLGVNEGSFKAYQKTAQGELSNKIKGQHLAFFVKGATIVHPESVELDKHEATLKAGAELQLTATVKPDNALDKLVEWKSLNTAIATVDKNGLVKAIAEGNTAIVVITDDGEKTDTCKLVVEKPAVPVTGVTLDKNEAQIKIGATLQLTATVAPENADVKDVEWSSSDEKIATVSATGLVTAVAKGEATITVTTKEGAKTATCKVKVVEEEQGVENIIANPEFNGKIMHQGTLYIIRDGKMYNVTGARVQ